MNAETIPAHGTRAAVTLVWAATPAVAVMNAEDYADERLRGEWAMTDWRPAS